MSRIAEDLRTRKASRTEDQDMPRRSHSYGRISTNGKNRQGKGDGLRRQQGRLDEADESWPERISREQGWYLDPETYTDPGRSAFHRKNLGPKAALTKILGLIETRRIPPGDVIIMDKLDRLTRAEVNIAYELFQKILSAGVWICTREPFRIYKGESSSFMDLMEPLWLMYLNWQESVKKADNAKHAWQAARHGIAKGTRKTHQAPPPWWIRKVDEAYELHPSYAPLMRRLCALTRELGIGRACAVLNRERVPSPTRSGRWAPSALYSILKRRDLVGEYQPHRIVDGKRVPDGPPVPGFYPALLTEEELADLRAAVAQRTNRVGRPACSGGENLFTGIIYDALTSHTLAMHWCGGSQGRPRYRYLHVAGEGEGRTNVRYEHLEDCVLDMLAMLRPQDVLDPASRTDQREHRIAELRSRLTALQLRQKQLQADAADPSKEYLLPVLDEVSRDLKSTAAELEHLRLESRTSRAEALADAQTVVQMRRQASGEQRRELDQHIKAVLPSIVDSIWVQTQRGGLGRGSRPRKGKSLTRTQIVHVQVWLKSGACRYAQILPRCRHKLLPWQLERWDLRRGPYRPADVADRADMAQAAQA